MSERAEFWARHLAAIEAEGVTTKVYAHREGLAVSALYQWRRHFKSGGRPSRAKAVSSGFVPVTVQAEAAANGCTVRVGDAVRLELAQLPSAEWLAALAAALGRRVR